MGAGIEAEAVREVAGRLLEEGRSRLETAPESALVALRQAFSLEQQFGVDGERLCCVCASVCHALSRIAQPYAPVAAIEPLVQGIETLDEMNDPDEDGCADAGDGQPGACPLGGTVDEAAAAGDSEVVEKYEPVGSTPGISTASTQA